MLLHAMIRSMPNCWTRGPEKRASVLRVWLLLLQGFLQEGKPVQVAAFLMLLRAKVLPWHLFQLTSGQGWRTQQCPARCVQCS